MYVHGTGAPFANKRETKGIWKGFLSCQNCKYIKKGKQLDLGMKPASSIKFCSEPPGDSNRQ